MTFVHVKKLDQLALGALLGIVLAGCGASDPAGPKGVYLPKNPGQSKLFIEKFDFQSGGKVAITIAGRNSVGEFITEDGYVRLTMPKGSGGRLKLADGGCLLAGTDSPVEAEAAKDGMDLKELELYCPE